jgi:AraC-like DNA-binding protein
MTSPQPDTRERFESSGTDPDAAIAMYAAAYDGHGFVATRTDRPFSFRHTSVGDSRMSLRGSRFDGRMRGTVEPKGEYIVSWIQFGECIMDVGRDEIRMQPNVPVMFPTNRPFAFDFADCEQSLVQFDKAYLERIAAERLGVPVGVLEFERGHMPSGDILLAWRRAISSVARVVLSRDPISPVLLAQTSHAAALALLDAFPHEIGSARYSIPEAATGRVRDAIDYMHVRAQEPISTTDVATQVGMSIRGLQQAFRRQLGEAPNTVLRGIRLDRVHEELRTASPSETTVAQVATRWGFAHLGRFSGAYASRFGEYPRDTLGR